MEWMRTATTSSALTGRIIWERERNTTPRRARSRSRTKAGGPPTALGEPDHEARGPVRAGLHALVVLAVAVGVHAVLVGVELERPLAQEGEVDRQLAGRPVGHRPQPPVAPVAAGQEHVVAQAGVQDTRLVPRGGDGPEELHDLGLPEVVRRSVREH